MGACAVLLAAFAVRAVGLGAQSLWWDEAYSALLAAQGPRAILRELRDFDFHPPAHYFLDYLWMPIAGRSEFALRFPSLVAGVLTVAIGARLGARLFGRVGGIIAGLAFAFSPFLVYYSQEARMYSAAGLFTVCALYAIDRALEHDEWRDWLAFVASTIAGLYTFYYFVFVPIAAAVYAMITTRRIRGRAVRFALAGVAVAIAYAPWLPVLVGRNAVWDSQWATTSSPLKVVTWTWQTLVVGIADPALLSQPAIAGILAALAILVFGSLLLSTRRSVSTELFAAAAFVVPVALIAAIAAVKPVFHPRYAVAAAPGLCLLVTGAIAAGWANGRGPRVSIRRALAGFVSLVAIAGAIYGNLELRTNPAYARDDYRGAVGYIEHKLQPKDVIIYNAHPGFAFYYHGSAPAGYFPPAPYDEDHIADALTQLAQGYDHIWYLMHSQVPNDPEGFVEQALARGTTSCDERWFGSLRVTCYAISPGAMFAGGTIVPAHQNVANRLLLTGYSIAQAEVPSAGAVEIRLRWQVTGATEDYGVWVGLQDESGNLWGREDRQPRDSKLLLSSGWQVGEAVTTRHRLPVLLGTPPGRYRVVAGVYRLADVRGLDVLDELGRAQGQSLTLTQIDITRTIPTAQTDSSLPGKGTGALAGGVELAGYQVDGARAGPGGKVRLALLWKAASRPVGNLDVIVRMTPAGGTPLTVSRDALGGTYRSGEWQAGEIVREQRDVRLPAGAPPGAARLEVGLAGPGAEPGAWASLGDVTLSAVTRSFDDPKPERRVDLDFADSGQPVVRLLGSKSLPEAVRRGDKLRVTLYWQSLGDVSTKYRVFVHVADTTGTVKAQRDGEPANWTRPTDSWLKGEVVEDVYEVDIGADVSPGDYSIRVGMYEPQSGARLRTPTDDHVDLGKLTVRQ